MNQLLKYALSAQSDFILLAKNIFICFHTCMTCEYYLISKNLGTYFNQYKGRALRMSSETPHTVDEVIVGCVGRKSQRKITTFRNSKGEIIERAFNYRGKPYRNILYSRVENVIAEYELVTSTTKKEYILQRGLLQLYKSFIDSIGSGADGTIFWTITKNETNHLSTNVNTGEKILSRTSVNFLPEVQREIHRFIEFPHLLSNKLKKVGGKLLYFEVDKNAAKVIPETIFSDGVKFSKNDKFLPYRAFDIDSLKMPVTKMFLTDRKLNHLEVSIDTKYVPDDEVEKVRLAACFIPSQGAICFNSLFKHKSKALVVRTARHETEHVWHYYLDARNGGYESGTWQGKIFDKYGRIKNKKLQVEADKCSESIENYVTFSEDYQEYLKNYVEAEANRVGKLMKEKYERQGEKLKNSLPHIPKELL